MPNEEEYHLPEGENPAYQTTTTSTAESLSSLAPKPRGAGIKKIIIFLIIIVVVWAGLRLFSAIKHSRKAKAQVQAITPLSPTPLSFQQAPMMSPTQSTATQAKSTHAGNAFNASAGTGLDNRLANIEEGNAEAQAKIERSNANLAEVQDTLTTLSSQMTALNNTIQDLSSQVVQQQSQIQQLMIVKEKKNKSLTSIQAVTNKKKEYFVQAIIPGRAWLASADQTITVRIGDGVPGYGVVSAIDPTQGIVSTSSGMSIAYSDEES